MLKSPKFLLFIIVSFTSIIYFKSLFNDLLFWDDNIYVINNKDITNLSFNSLKTIFSGFYAYCYLPLTMLTYSLEYHFFGLNPFIYHLDNLVLHLFNIILVFIFIYKLSLGSELREINTRQYAISLAFIVALLFAIHPMHVESVAWISERKDLLYSFFFLSSLIFYIKYISQIKSSIIHYPLSIILFFLSCLSKPTAVTLPFVLILIDYFFNRFSLKSKVKLFKEKIPFFILSLLFLIIAFYSQKHEIVVNSADDSYFNLFHRIFLFSFALTFYLYKVIAPFHLSVIHSFLGNAKHFPSLYYISSLILLIIPLIIFISGKSRKLLIFGFLFFFTTIALSLQIIPFRFAIVCERYTYIPYIGLFFIIACIFQSILKNHTYLLIILVTVPDSLFLLPFL